MTGDMLEAEGSQVLKKRSAMKRFGKEGELNGALIYFASDACTYTTAQTILDTLHGTGGVVLEYATIVKLTRTLAIIPITVVLSLIRIKKEKKQQFKMETTLSMKKIFPMFILYFIFASIITTIITSFCTGTMLMFAEKSFDLLKQFSKFFIIMAMSAIGFNTNIVTLFKKGGKPIFMGFCCWIAIAVVCIILQCMLGNN